MNAKTAGMLLSCYRPGKKVDPRIIKAVRFAEGDETLRRILEDQMDFDEQVVEAIHSIKPPENLRAKLGEITAATPEARPPARTRRPARPASLRLLRIRRSSLICSPPHRCDAVRYSDSIESRC